jgi:hypothetical protein
MPIQGDSRRKFKILGGDSNGHCYKKVILALSNSEWLPRYVCLHLQIKSIIIIIIIIITHLLTAIEFSLVAVAFTLVQTK